MYLYYSYIHVDLKLSRIKIKNLTQYEKGRSIGSAEESVNNNYFTQCHTERYDQLFTFSMRIDISVQLGRILLL